MKVMLVRSPFESDEEWYLDLPLGVLNLATILYNNNYNVGIIDLQLYKSEGYFEGDVKDFTRVAEKLLEDFEVDIVGFSIMSCSFPEVVRIAKECKRIRPEVKILFGGSQPALVAEETLKYFKEVDYVFKGEGERSIIQVIDSIRGELSKQQAPGLVYRDEGSIISNPEAELIEDLDSLPYININLLEKKEKYLIKEHTISIDVGRGCPFRCSFCSTSIFWKNKFRMKSAIRIVSEIEYFNKNFGCDKFNLHHDLFTFDKQFVDEFCDLIIEKNLKIKWACSSRASYVSKELLHKMRKSGCNNVFYGLESGSDKILKNMRKGTSARMAVNAIKDTYESGISATYSFIIGNQGESMEDLEKTLMMAIYGKSKGAKIVLINQLRPESGTGVMEEINGNYFLDEEYVRKECLVVKDCKETMDLIKRYPQLFSHFYFVDTEEIHVSKFIEYANDFHYLINLFSYTLYVLCFRLKISIFEIHDKFKEFYIKEYKQETMYLLDSQQIAFIFPKVIEQFYWKVKGHEYLSDLANYESKLAEKKERENKKIIIFKKIQQIKVIDKPYITLKGSIGKYDYNIIKLRESIQKEDFTEDNYLETCYIILDREESYMTKVKRIDKLTYDFTLQCNGSRSIRDIILNLYEKNPELSIEAISGKVFDIIVVFNKERYIGFL